MAKRDRSPSPAVDAKRVHVLAETAAARLAQWTPPASVLERVRDTLADTPEKAVEPPAGSTGTRDTAAETAERTQLHGKAAGGAGTAADSDSSEPQTTVSLSQTAEAARRGPTPSGTLPRRRWTR